MSVIANVEYRRKLLADVKAKKHATDLQQSSITDRRNVLRTRIRGWEVLQRIYMPGLLQIQTNISRQSIHQSGSDLVLSHAETISLWFPSALPDASRRVACSEGLPAMEDRLRAAHCHDALYGIRNTLRLKTHMVYFKNKNSRGQREGLRSRSLIDRVQGRVQILADKYRCARKAKLILAGPGPWMDELQDLLDIHLRSYADPDLEANKARKTGVSVVDDEDGDARVPGRHPAGESRRII